MTGPEGRELLPMVLDPDTAGFFDAAREQKLAVYFCSTCDAPLHLPRSYCNRCGSSGGDWRAVPLRGKLHSWTVVEHQVHEAFPVPYTLVLVDLDEPQGVRLVSDLAGPRELRVGMPMKCLFEEVADGVVLPKWEPSEVDGANEAPR